MATLIEVLVSGLALGAIYALVGLSLNVVYITTRVVSFAQGDIGMLVVAGTLWLGDHGGRPLAVDLVLALAGAAVVAVLVDLIAVRAIRGGVGVAAYGWIVSTLGVSIVIQNSTAMWFGTESRGFPHVLPTGTIELFGAVIPTERLLTVAVVAALILLLALAVAKTQWGRVARALADNQPIAAACGVPTNWIRTSVVLVGAALVGVAAMLSAPQTFVNAYIGTSLLLNGMVAIVLGGLGNVRAGLVGGLVLGVANAIAGRYLDSTLVPYVPFVLLLVWLIFGADVRGKLASARAARRRDPVGVTA
jgi:branched-chain amino acid transport system permease protein